MTDPIKDAPGIVTVAAGEVKTLELKVEGNVTAVEAHVEADAAAEDAAIDNAVRDIFRRALEDLEAELVKAHAAEQRALAWAKARRWALLGIGIGLLVIVIAHRVG